MNHSEREPYCIVVRLVCLALGSVWLGATRLGYDLLADRVGLTSQHRQTVPWLALAGAANVVERLQREIVSSSPRR